MTAVQKLKPVVSPEREALRKAIQERNTVKDACARCDLAARNGEELLRSAEAKLAKFDDVDEKIVQHRAAKFKRAATGGPAPDTDLPDDLTKRRYARDEAWDMLAAAKAAHASLVAELEDAQKGLQRAEHKVSEAAGADILAAEAIRLSTALRTAWNAVWLLNDVLHAMPIPAPSDAVDIIRQVERFDHRQFAGGRNPALTQAGEDWRTWLAELCEDADANSLKFDDGGPKTPVVSSAA